MRISSFFDIHPSFLPCSSEDTHCPTRAQGRTSRRPVHQRLEGGYRDADDAYASSNAFRTTETPQLTQFGLFTSGIVSSSSSTLFERACNRASPFTSGTTNGFLCTCRACGLMENTAMPASCKASSMWPNDGAMA